MGWASGTDLVCDIAHAIKTNVKEQKARKALYRALVDAAENADWDCQNEAEGIDPILDEILGAGQEES